MDRYARMFARLAKAREGAFGAFVMLGDPDLETSAAILEILARSGADMVEVGIPFSDPVADGPVIQASAQRALAAGVRPANCFRLIAEFRGRHPSIPVGILTYANLVVARGSTGFYGAAAEAGADSVLVADVPLIEAPPFVEAARAAGVAPVLIAAANTPAARLARIAALGAGYVYCVARAGVTGADERVSLDHASLLAALRAHHSPPAIFGFGIARPDHVRAALDAGAAGAISGSAIVDLVARRDLERLARFIAAMKAATRLRAAAA